MTHPAIRLAGLGAAALVLAFPAVVSAKQRCSYLSVKRAPHVSHLVASRLQCSSARKVMSAVRLNDDWRGAFYGDRFGYVSFATGVHQNRRKFRCDYRLRGRKNKYVSVACHDVARPRVTTRAELRRR